MPASNGPPGRVIGLGRPLETRLGSGPVVNVAPVLGLTESLDDSVVVHFGRQAVRPTALRLASGHLQIDLPAMRRGLNSRGEFGVQSARLMLFSFFQVGKSLC